MQRLEEDVRHLDAEKHEHESTIIEQQDHIEKLQDSCRELQEAAQALQQDSDLKYAASIAQMKAERKQQVEQVFIFSASPPVHPFVSTRSSVYAFASTEQPPEVRCQHCPEEGSLPTAGRFTLLTCFLFLCPPMHLHASCFTLASSSKCPI